MAKKRDFYIVHQDKDMIIVDKPPGLLAVPIPNSAVKNLQSLVNQFVGKQGGSIWTAHRIDRFTSGLMVFAKKERTYHYLKDLFRSHQVKRTYLALVRGIPSPRQGELLHHLKRIKEGFRNIVVSKDDPSGTRAHLWYSVKEELHDASLVEVELDTGLKNQIRVQFAEAGHPVIGDQHYVEKEASEPLINRQALHAWKLSFPHPSTKKSMTFEAKLPGDMKGLMRSYQK